MFEKTNNNYQNSTSVNTRLYASYGEDSLLTVSAWNTNLTIKLQPAKGKTEEGLTQYSSEQSEAVSAVVSPESDMILLDGIEKVIIPAIDKKESASIAVLTGSPTKRKIINIVTKEGKVGLSVIFGGTINLDGTSEGTSAIDHTFSDRKYYKDYVKDAGGTGVEIPSDFYAFVSKLREISFIDGAINHGITASKANKSSFAPKPNNQTDQTNTYSAPVTNVGDGSIEGFLPFD